MTSFPKTIASWRTRIDQVDTVWAADPNALASEIIAVENAVGTMPQTEPSPPVGNPVTYKSLSARVTDTALGAQHPYIELYNADFWVGQGSALSTYGVFNSYRVVEDNWGYFNGSDITIRAPGVYAIDAYQTWVPYNNGWVHLMLGINNVVTRSSMWHWNDFPANAGRQSYYERWATTSFFFMGALNKGDRIRIASEQQTSAATYRVVNSTLRCLYLRTLTSAQAKAGPSSYPG